MHTSTFNCGWRLFSHNAMRMRNGGATHSCKSTQQTVGGVKSSFLKTPEKKLHSWKKTFSSCLCSFTDSDALKSFDWHASAQVLGGMRRSRIHRAASVSVWNKAEDRHTTCHVHPTPALHHTCGASVKFLSVFCLIVFTGTFWHTGRKRQMPPRQHNVLHMAHQSGET